MHVVEWIVRMYTRFYTLRFIAVSLTNPTRGRMCVVVGPVWKGMPRDGAKFILTACKFPPEEYAWGRSKLFIRNPITLFKLEEIRKQRCIELATKIQVGDNATMVYIDVRHGILLQYAPTYTHAQSDVFAYMLMFHVSNVHTLLHDRHRSNRGYVGSPLTIATLCTMCPQAIWRGFQCKKVFKEQRRAVTLIAAFVRGRRDRKRYIAKREGALLVTAYYRMWRERRTFEEHQTKLLMSKAAIIITSAAKGFLVRKKYRKCFRVHAGGSP